MRLLRKWSETSMKKGAIGKRDRHAGGDPVRCKPRDPVAGLFLGAALALGAPGFAAAQSESGTHGGWQFEISPYLWAAGVKATSQIGDLPQTNVDKSFSDLVSKLVIE